MSDMKHTPGPWKIGYGGILGDQHFTVMSDGHLIADYATPHALPSEEVCANARLIAAAPDLLEACRELRHMLLVTIGAVAEYADFTDEEQAAARAEAAIAKAEGSQS